MIKVDVNFNFYVDGSQCKEAIPSKRMTYSEYYKQTYEEGKQNGNKVNTGIGFEKANYLEAMPREQFASFWDRIDSYDRNMVEDMKNMREPVDFSRYVPAMAIPTRKNYVAPVASVFECPFYELENIPRAIARLRHMSTLDIEELECWREDLKYFLRIKPNAKGKETMVETYKLLNYAINSRFIC